MNRFVILVRMALASAAGLAASQAWAQDIAREIVQERGNVYRVRAGGADTVFLTGGDGIILGDALDRDTAGWLKDELARRFPDRPVRYVILTSHTLARAEGGSVFASEATLVGHDNFGDALNRARATLSPDFAALDRDRNDRLEAAEIAASPQRSWLLARDRNRDGVVTAREVHRSVSDVSRRFRDRLTLSVGSSSVTIVHAGWTHLPEASVLVFPAERIVSATDAPPLTLRGGFGAYPPQETLRWARLVDGLEFDTLLTADGRTIAHADITAFHQYLSALFETVADAFDAGHSIAEIEASSRLDAFRGSALYAERRSHIVAAYQSVRLRSAEFYGVGLTAMMFGNAEFCDGFIDCSRVTRGLGATFGVRMSSWRHLGFAGEVTVGRDRASARTRGGQNEQLSQRDTRVALLARFASRPNQLVAAFVGGASYTVTDTKGVSIARGSVLGPRPINEQQSRVGATVGMEFGIRLSRDTSVLFPIRGTFNFGDDDDVRMSPVAAYDVQAGIGIAIRFKNDLGIK